MFLYNMISLTNKPTRVTRHSGNAIDHIITNSVTVHNDFKSAIIKTDLSDYFPIVFVIKINETTQRPVVKSTYKRSCCEKNIDKFKNTLRNRNWDDVKKLEDSNKAYKYFLDIRSSHRKCSVTRGVLRNFTKFTGKHLCQSLFFNKVAGLRPAILLKKKLWHRCFPVNFRKFLRTPFLQSTSGGCFLRCHY